MCNTVRRIFINNTNKDTEINFIKLWLCHYLYMDLKFEELKTESKTETVRMRMLRRVAGYTVKD
jgi:hypothetical protein